MDAFEAAFARVVGLEGGYINDPNDPGGRTIHGITERDHPDLWVNGPPSLEQAKARYRRDYWDKVIAGRLPPPLALFVFDAAVNQGVDAAVRMLQRAVRVPVDGRMGSRTLAAVEDAGDPVELAALYLAERGLRYTGTRNFDHYGRGWFKRLFKIALLST